MRNVESIPSLFSADPYLNFLFTLDEPLKTTCKGVQMKL